MGRRKDKEERSWQDRAAATVPRSAHTLDPSHLRPLNLPGPKVVLVRTEVKGFTLMSHILPHRVCHGPAPPGCQVPCWDLSLESWL